MRLIRNHGGESLFQAERGAVLLEVILALVLFVAAAAIVMGGLSASMDSVERQRLNAHAANLAVTVLSELQMGLRSSAALGPEDFDAPYGGWSWELAVTMIEGDFDAAPGLSSVEVIIRHQDPPMTYRLAQVVRLGQGQSPTERKEAAGAKTP